MSSSGSKQKKTVSGDRKWTEKAVKGWRKAKEMNATEQGQAEGLSGSAALLCALMWHPNLPLPNKSFRKNKTVSPPFGSRRPKSLESKHPGGTQPLPDSSLGKDTNGLPLRCAQHRGRATRLQRCSFSSSNTRGSQRTHTNTSSRDVHTQDAKALVWKRPGPEILT